MPEMIRINLCICNNITSDLVSEIVIKNKKLLTCNYWNLWSVRQC